MLLWVRNNDHSVSSMIVMECSSAHRDKILETGKTHFLNIHSFLNFPSVFSDITVYELDLDKDR